MFGYDEMKKELDQISVETNDEINYYDKKIKEFTEKKEREKLIFIASKEKLDQYVIDNYNKNKLKSWLHFMTTEKTRKANVFFAKFFKNTGLGISKVEKKEVKIVFNPSGVVNMQKAADTLNTLFEIAKRSNIEDFKIKIVDLNSKNAALYLYKREKDQTFYVKTEDGKKATLREKSALIIINKLMSKK